MPQHLHIEADFEEQILAAEKQLVPLLDPTSEEHLTARDAGQLQIAKASAAGACRLFQGLRSPNQHKPSEA